VICRMWHGWTSEANASAYKDFLLHELFPEVERELRGQGYLGYDLLQTSRDAEVEFVTLLWFESLDAVRAFAGDLYEAPVIHEKAKKLLSHYDQRTDHFTVLGSHRLAGSGANRGST